MADASPPSKGSDVTHAPERVVSAKRFGRYRLSFELASGGMGTVYLARAEGPAGFEQLVALKRIHDHLAKDERFVAMFLDEARITARIHHPNVCGVVDFGREGDSYYLTMPFLAGESLHRVLRTVSRLEDPELGERFAGVAIRIVADACEGLHAAHELRDERGEPLEVVHRDVSPQNLLVGYDGGVRVLDFGVASARHRLQSTATGEVKGKFAYLSPEQIEGQKVDRRADVWALGVVLYECLARRRLFSRKTMAETVQAVLGHAIQPLSETAPHVPIALEEVVFKALARDPERRYPTARAMGRDLLAFLAEQGRSVGPAEVAELMSALFPSGESEKRRMLEEARADEGDDAREAPTVAASVAPRSRTALALASAIAAALAIGVGGTLLFMGAGAERRVEPASAEPPREIEPAVAAHDVAATAVSAVPASTAEVAGDAPDARAEAPTQSEEADEDARDEAEPPAARGRGSLSVVTPGGWAIVYRGRSRIGEAPGTFAMPAGTHVIGIQPFGRGEIVRRRVRVAPGATARLSVPVR